MKYIDLFAGAGGLSEGFIREGFEPVAHVEMNKEACFTLKTRLAFHYLKANSNLEPYKKYLKKEITREQLYENVPTEILESVIGKTRDKNGILTVFSRKKIA